jgi:hypothetical protein
VQGDAADALRRFEAVDGLVRRMAAADRADGMAVEALVHADRRHHQQPVEHGRHGRDGELPLPAGHHGP